MAGNNDRENADFLKLLRPNKKQKKGEEDEFAPEKLAVETSNADDEVWLVKVPKVVYMAWIEAENGAELGTATIAPAVGRKRARVDVEVAALPELRFGMEPQGVSTATQVFSEETLAAAVHGQARRRILRLEGLVTSRMTMMPVRDSEYEAMVKDRKVAAGTRVAHTKAVAASEIARTFKEEPVSEAAVEYEHAMAAAAPRRQLRTAIPREQLETRVVQLLEQNRYMTRREINDIVEQPDAKLTAVLKDWTIKHTSGEYKNYYELKPEFSPHVSKPPPPAPQD